MTTTTTTKAFPTTTGQDPGARLGFLLALVKWASLALLAVLAYLLVARSGAGPA